MKKLLPGEACYEGCPDCAKGAMNPAIERAAKEIIAKHFPADTPENALCRQWRTDSVAAILERELHYSELVEAAKTAEWRIAALLSSHLCMSHKSGECSDRAYAEDVSARLRSILAKIEEGK